MTENHEKNSKIGPPFPSRDPSFLTPANAKQPLLAAQGHKQQSVFAYFEGGIQEETSSGSKNVFICPKNDWLSADPGEVDDIASFYREKTPT